MRECNTFKCFFSPKLQRLSVVVTNATGTEWMVVQQAPEIHIRYFTISLQRKACYGTTVIVHRTEPYPGVTQRVEITDFCLGNKTQLLRKARPVQLVQGRVIKHFQSY